ncbi:uncharacterized protein LOC111255435 [Varroa destructor]|uniref:Uncharacterized protein n=1 Tax=Varroa destructor TaxID=109461 RepID=A0A7M7KZC3_VARDE|nr:uncharacterized protein LOC111255435 [Varroa destructor]
MRVLFVLASAAAFAAQDIDTAPKLTGEPVDLLAQETQQGGADANWFDVIHNDDLWNKNIKDGPEKQMLVTLEKGSRARLPGPPHHGRFPPSYPPQKGRWDSRDQPGWQNNLQDWPSGPRAPQWQRPYGPTFHRQGGWRNAFRGPAPGPQGDWQQRLGPRAGPNPHGEGKKVVILVSLPNSQQGGTGGAYGGHGHGFKGAPMEMIEGIRQKHNSAPVVYVSLDKGGNAHSQQHFPAKGGHGSHGGVSGGNPQKVVLLFIKERRGGRGRGAGWVQGGPVGSQRKPGGYGGPQMNSGWDDGPINNDINVGGGWSNGPHKNNFQHHGWPKAGTGYSGGPREKGMGYFTGQPEMLRGKIQSWDRQNDNSYNRAQPQYGWDQKPQYEDYYRQQQPNYSSQHEQPAKPSRTAGYGRPIEPFDDEFPITKPAHQSIDNGGWQPIVSRPGTDGWVPRPTTPPSKKDLAYAPETAKPPGHLIYNRVEKTSSEHKFNDDHHGGIYQQQHQYELQNINNYHGHQQQKPLQQNHHHHHQKQQQQTFDNYQRHLNNLHSDYQRPPQSNHEQQRYYDHQNYGNINHYQQQTYYNNNQQQQNHFDGYNVHKEQKNYGSGHQGDSGHRPEAGGERPTEAFDLEDAPAPGYGGPGQLTDKPKQNPYQEQSWNAPATPAPSAAIHHHGEQTAGPGAKTPATSHPKSIQDIRNAQGWQQDGAAQQVIDPGRIANASPRKSSDLPQMQHWTPQYAASSPIAITDNAQTLSPEVAAVASVSAEPAPASVADAPTSVVDSYAPTTVARGDQTTQYATTDTSSLLPSPAKV